MLGEVSLDDPKFFKAGEGSPVILEGECATKMAGWELYIPIEWEVSRVQGGRRAYRISGPSAGD
jgi:hypothetical protein